MAEKKLLFIKPDLARQIKDLLSWRRSFSVNGAASFVNTPTTCSVGLPRARNRPTPRASGKDYTVKVIEAAAHGETYDGLLCRAGTGLDPTSSSALAIGEVANTTDAPECVVVNTWGIGKATHFIPDDRVLNGRFGGYATNGKMVIEVDYDPGMFVVTLTQTGGADGDGTTAPSWTYTCENDFGDDLATARGPQVGRTEGSFTAATKGLGYYDDAGAFQLLIAFEAPDTYECPEE